MNQFSLRFFAVLFCILASQSCDQLLAQTVYRSYRPTYQSSYPSAYRSTARYPNGTRRIVYANGAVRYVLPGGYSNGGYSNGGYSNGGYSSSGYSSRQSSGRSSSTRSSATKSNKSAYRLDAGDAVAVIVQGVTGDFAKAPVHMPRKGDGTLPAVGHPMVVLRDGTLPMPLINPVNVRGMTVIQARDAVAKAYLAEEVLNKKNQVTLSLMRKRTVNVSVLHDDPYNATRSVSQVKLPADRANVLNAMVESGPFDSKAAVSVINGRGQRTSGRTQLTDGDVVQLKSAPSGSFFTGGSLRGGEFSLPRGRSLNALQAMSLAGGVQNQTALGPREVIVVRRGGGASRVGYSTLLNNPNSLIMMPGDTLIVR